MISSVIISKDEEGLDGTPDHVWQQARDLTEPSEIIWVDAAVGSLGPTQPCHVSEVQWLNFEAPTASGISIPHQRSTGVCTAGEGVVFTDAGRHPEPDRLALLMAPLQDGEDVTVDWTAGIAARTAPYHYDEFEAGQGSYLRECSTISLSFRGESFDAVGAFEEGFAYGSDVDFCWQWGKPVTASGKTPDAVICDDWWKRRQQLRRSNVYDRARTRPYPKLPVTARRPAS